MFLSIPNWRYEVNFDLNRIYFLILFQAHVNKKLGIQNKQTF